MKNILRPAVAADRDAIIALYKKVSRISGGLARGEEEVTVEYISDIIEKTQKQAGIHFVMVQVPEGDGSSARAAGADQPAGSGLTGPHAAAGAIIGEIHCYKPDLKCFDHMLSDLTIAVDPDCQGQGIGKALFTAVLDEVRANRKDILRVELLTADSNKRALAFYQSLGFTIEGRMPNRYRPPASVANPGDPPGATAFETDIPMAWMNPNYAAAGA